MRINTRSFRTLFCVFLWLIFNLQNLTFEVSRSSPFFRKHFNHGFQWAWWNSENYKEFRLPLFSYSCGWSWTWLIWWFLSLRGLPRFLGSDALVTCLSFSSWINCATNFSAEPEENQSLCKEFAYFLLQILVADFDLVKLKIWFFWVVLVFW